MNKIPQHKASQYSDMGVVLYPFVSQGTSHTPIRYAHQDDYYVFGLLTHGKACGIVDFKEIQLAESDVFVIQPGQIHRFVSAEQAEGWLLMTDSKYVSHGEKCVFDNFSLSASSFRIDEKRKEELRQIATLIEHRLTNGAEQEADAAVPHLAEAFIAIIAEAAQEPSSRHTTLNPRQAEIVLTFRNMLAEHLSAHRQPSYYASLLNISTVYLNEVVKKTTGMNTASYIKGEVVLQAKRMLVHTNLSARQIADRLGFCDYAYFSRLFSQATGVNPTAFRQKNHD